MTSSRIFVDPKNLTLTDLLVNTGRTDRSTKAGNWGTCFAGISLGPENGVFTNFDPERPSRNLISVRTVEVAEMLVGKLEACDC
jgi:hypothetical protein